MHIAAGDAGLRVDAAGVACRTVDLVGARGAGDRLDLGVRQQVDHLVLADRHHLRREDAGGAVERREGLVEHRHVAADGAGALDEVDLLAGVGDLEGRLDAGDAAADDQRGRVGLGRPWATPPAGTARRRRRRRAIDLARSEDSCVARAVFAKRGQPDLLGVAAGQGHRPGERRLEEPRRVAGDHDGVEPGRRDLVAESGGVDPGQGAQQAYGFDLRQIRRVVRHGFESGLIGQRIADLADVHSNPHRASPVAFVSTPMAALRYPSDARAGGSRSELVKGISIYCAVYHHPVRRSSHFLSVLRCMTHVTLGNRPVCALSRVSLACPRHPKIPALQRDVLLRRSDDRGSQRPESRWMPAGCRRLADTGAA